MRETSTTIVPLTIVVISRQHLLWLGLQNMFERAETPLVSDAPALTDDA